MAQKDYLGSPKSIKMHLVFDQKEFCKALDAWYTNLGYRYLETGYTEKQLANGTKKLNFTWSGEKKVSAYLKLLIDLEYTSSTKDIVIERDEKKMTLQEGDLTLEFQGLFKKDIRDEWGIRPPTASMKFLREAYDKLFGIDKFAKYESQLKKDVDKLLNDIKTYLKLHRFD